MQMEKIIPTHAVKAVITNEQGDILFLQRDGRARADGRSNWDLPGGLVEEGENDRVALEREVEEELKRKSKVEQELGRWAFFRPFDGQTVEVTNYAVTLLDADTSNLTLSDEHTAARFVSGAELPTLDVKDPSIFNALGK
jgi:8-oxo-dGTP diphosphatase